MKVLYVIATSKLRSCLNRLSLSLSLSKLRELTKQTLRHKSMHFKVLISCNVNSNTELYHLYTESKRNAQVLCTVLSYLASP